VQAQGPVRAGPPVATALVLTVALALAGCSSGPPAAQAPAPDSPTTTAPPPTTAPVPPPTSLLATTTVPATTTPATPAPATPPPAAAAPGARSAAGAVVVLDPGHNGANGSHPGQVNAPVPDGRGGTKACNTTGTSTDGGYPEHAFTFAVATETARLLQAQGVTVRLTRPDDSGVGPCVDERAAIGNRAGADVVVSIHGDGAAAAGHGFHVAYASPPLDAAQSGPSPSLARTVRDTLVADGLTPSTYLGREGLDPRADLAGLNLSTQPTVLVELVNMRNGGDAAAATSTAGRTTFARALADAVLAWLAAR
jgi:N-acetylmuramoyl-L-alanine amidase